jgi:hypothetical protein
VLARPNLNSTIQMAKPGWREEARSLQTGGEGKKSADPGKGSGWNSLYRDWPRIEGEFE